MLTTKPLGGLSCASCGTNLESLSNNPPNDYNNWLNLTSKLSGMSNHKLGSLGFSKKMHKISLKTHSTDHS
jgi:hypothetical protein